MLLSGLMQVDRDGLKELPGPAPAKGIDHRIYIFVTAKIVSPKTNTETP